MYVFKKIYGSVFRDSFEREYREHADWNHWNLIYNEQNMVKTFLLEKHWTVFIIEFKIDSLFLKAAYCDIEIYMYYYVYVCES